MRLSTLFVGVAVIASTLAMPFNQAWADQVGVILMHGKWGSSKPKSPIGQLKSELDNKGFLVLAPDMPWSESRFLEKDFDEAMAEIDGFVDALKSKGASKIVVGGHSMGANAALGYGARREGLAGILAIAPGHIPEIGTWQQLFEFSVDEAKQKVSAGKGDEVVDITDRNQGKDRDFSLKARVVASWFAPDVGAVMPLNASNLKPGTPLMWIVGESDGMANRGSEYAFDKAPPHPKSRYEVVKGGHKVTPMKGKSEIISWLNSL